MAAPDRTFRLSEADYALRAMVEGLTANIRENLKAELMKKAEEVVEPVVDKAMDSLKAQITSWANYHCMSQSLEILVRKEPIKWSTDAPVK